MKHPVLHPNDKNEIMLTSKTRWGFRYFSDFRAKKRRIPEECNCYICVDRKKLLKEASK